MGSALLTAGILLGITFLFILFFSILQKRGKNKKLAERNEKYNSLVQSNKLAVNEREDFDSYLIALDTSSAYLVYFDFSSNEKQGQVLNLKEFRTARLDVEESSIYEDRRGKSILVDKKITKLQLALDRKNTNQTPVLLPFYKYQDGATDLGLLKARMEYWRSKICKVI